MTLPVAPSTLILTLLLGIGLLFFVKASVKERIQQERFRAMQSAETLLRELQQYFTSRAYKIVSSNPDQNQITFEGQVRPSWFLAILLTLLTIIGLLCLALVLSMITPIPQPWFLGLVALAPIAGIFYWKGAGRTEQVSLKLDFTDPSAPQPLSIITVTGHRDELALLKQAFDLKPLEAVS
ncbi:MAG: cofactor assembly of complex C subunit B [Oscillatoriales cyanobacterium RM2_1_1]|nr:cofactor assembly of complex C subunit B [Oscillatoriales cyanobacterium SM2_3_0]NJO44371.1 cofactor assembly of complex C subunit B [Oscillatoriales cyanobacterium RM2_1_1]